jgi:hypothetical protein
MHPPGRLNRQFKPQRQPGHHSTYDQDQKRRRTVANIEGPEIKPARAANVRISKQAGKQPALATPRATPGEATRLRRAPILSQKQT